jgi:acetyl-CoA carboxylase carboxyl transferase subunit beta
MLPLGFLTADFLLEHGLIDLVTPRANLRPSLGSLFDLYHGARPVKRTARRRRADVVEAPVGTADGD